MLFAAVAGVTLFMVTVSTDAFAGSVAFTAALSELTSLEADDTIVYQQVYTNIGNAYNQDTGLFTAPKDGIYAFHIHAVSSNDQELSIDLYMNNEATVSAYGRQGELPASGGNSFVVPLMEGDEVSVRARKRVLLLGTQDDGINTFTGYFISELVFDDK